MRHSDIILCTCQRDSEACALKPIKVRQGAMTQQQSGVQVKWTYVDDCLGQEACLLFITDKRMIRCKTRTWERDAFKLRQINLLCRDVEFIFCCPIMMYVYRDKKPSNCNSPTVDPASITVIREWLSVYHTSIVCTDQPTSSFLQAMRPTTPTVSYSLLRMNA